MKIKLITENKPQDYRLSIRLPAEFYFRFSKMKEDAFKKNEKIFINNIIIEALNKHFKELGYPTIGKEE